MANTLIHESRRILLPFDTLVDALIELETKHGRWPSGATLEEVTMLGGPEESSRSIELSIRVPRQEALAKRTYPLPLIAAAIVNYCLTMRVPMPRSSTKTIQVLPDGIALVLENTLMLPRRHQEAPPVKIVSADAPESAPQSAPTSGADGSQEGAEEGAEAAPHPEPAAQPQAEAPLGDPPPPSGPAQS